MDVQVRALIFLLLTEELLSSRLGAPSWAGNANCLFWTSHCDVPATKQCLIADGSSLQPRHLRALRVYDENAPLALPAGKMQTLHQRNKSTPVLSTLAQFGGIKAAAKRTAFADVSNVVRNPSARDDLAVHGKGLYDPVKDKFTATVNEVSKPAANLQRPAQRPLSAVVRKPLAIQSLVTPAEDIASEPEALAEPPVQKVVTKRATTIFRESVEM
jgi:G2/mitotic-specific cyclin 3/4